MVPKLLDDLLEISVRDQRGFRFEAGSVALG